MALPTELMHASGLYAIVNRESGAFYIGSAAAFGKRWRAHRGHLNRGDHPNVHLQRAWTKYGAAAFDFVPTAVIPPEDVKTYEQRQLDRLVGHPLCYNIARDASAPMAGRQHTPECRALTTERFKGKPKSPEHRAKIAAGLHGIQRSPDHCAKLAEANRRRVVSDETRAKMSRSHKGLPGPMQGRKHTAEALAKISAAAMLMHARRRGEVG